MKYLRNKIIYCQNESGSQVIEKLRNELPKKCGLFVDGEILVLTSRLQQGGGQYGMVTGSISMPHAVQLIATVKSYPLGSTVTAILQQPGISSKYTVLLVLVGLLITWCIGYVFHRTTLPSMPSQEGMIQLAVFFGGIFFLAHSWDRAQVEQREKLLQYLEEALKQ